MEIGPYILGIRLWSAKNFPSGTSDGNSRQNEYETDQDEQERVTLVKANKFHNSQRYIHIALTTGRVSEGEIIQAHKIMMRLDTSTSF